ncbi:MAG: Do family serine endopeptidase [Pseudoxanthomonas sp.]
MNPSVRNNLFGLLILTTPLAACAQQPSSAPQGAAPAAVSSIAQSSAPQIVTGLPDFTQLVEQVGPGVVNIEAKVGTRQVAREEQMPEQDDMPELFRRFFGPGMPGPQGPQQPQRRGTSMGSGFIISPDGYVLTNHHVVEGADEVTVKLSDRRSFKAKVVGSDEAYDVALLKIDATRLPSLRLGDSNILKPGQWVVAIGSPFGLDHSVTAGVVSATSRMNPFANQQYVQFIQTDVAINQGNSGGPLLNTRGEVVGINSQIFSASGGYMGISFAIPIDLAVSAAEQLKKTGKVSRSMLGVNMQAEITDAEAKGLNLPDTRGALVAGVQEGSGAAKAGIEPGDVITAFNGQKINSREELPPLVGPLPAGSKATITVIRNGKPRDFTVTLSELDTGALAARDDDDADNAAGPQTAPVADLLGVQVANIDAPTRQRLGLKAGEGVRITGVSRQLAMDDPRLRPGLIVLQVGRTPVGSAAEFARATAGAKKGDVVMLLARDPSPGGGSQFLAITVGGEG